MLNLQAVTACSAHHNSLNAATFYGDLTSRLVRVVVMAWPSNTCSFDELQSGVANGQPARTVDAMALLFDTFFGSVDNTSEPALPARTASRVSRKRSASIAAKVSKKAPNPKVKKQPATCTWFDLDALAKIPAADVLYKPPFEPLRLGSDFTGYGTDSLACHYLGLSYKVVFLAEKSVEKDVLRTALETHVTGKTPAVKYSDVRKRTTKDAPACDIFVAGPPCITFSSLGKGEGTDDSKGRLMYHSLRYIVDKLPRIAIIENVRGLTFRRHAGLLQHVKDCLQAAGYTVHVRIQCTSGSAVPQSRGRCYIVGIRSPRVPFQWPKVVPTVKLEHFLDTKNVQLEHPLNSRQKTILRKLQEKHKGRLEKSWYCFDAGASWRYVQCLKDKSPCLTRTRAGGHYVPKLRRFLSLVEHGSLQGLPHSATLHMAEAAGGEERMVRAALGDAMSLNVLMRVLGKALYSAGLVAEVPRDPWRQMAKDYVKCNLPSGGARVLPDVYLERDGAILK